MCKYVNGMLSGLLVGAVVGMMILPQLDRKTQRNFKKASNRLMDFAEDSCGYMSGMR